jgi:hypothetical protein
MHSVRIVLMATFSMAALSLATVRPVFMSAFHVEVAFGYIVVFAFQDLLEAANGVGHRNLFTASQHLPRFRRPK